MKFMCPTCPMVGFSEASPVSTRLPPCRPASHTIPSRCWLSAKSFSTLTCRMAPPPLIAVLSMSCDASCSSIVRPRHEQAVQLAGIGGSPELVAKRLVAEHLCQLGQKLEMLLGDLLGYEEHEHMRDWPAV